MLFRRFVSSQFVPRHEPTKQSDVELLANFLKAVEKPNSPGGLLVLTGAGLSTESGIPDYRSEDVGLYATSNRRPVQHKVFMDSEPARRSYWARNFLGWPRWSNFQPNAAHFVLGCWERRGLVNCVITQNVDQLHYKAGSANVLELHGTNSIVQCMSCSYTISRLTFQKILEQHNPNMSVVSENMTVRPDGDMDIPQEVVDNFHIPFCPKCGEGSILKPNVVFFGDNVPQNRVQKVRKQVENCHSLLVLGSSLFVFSGESIKNPSFVRHH